MTKDELIELLRKDADQLAQESGGNIQIQIDVQLSSHNVKIRITENY